jgi:DNA-binding MarR family transcriptional regulator
MKRSIAPEPRQAGLTDPVLQFLEMLWRLQHALERASKHMEDTLGVSGPQRFALRVIGASPDIGAGELAASLHLHPSTVTGILQRLESRGFITRVRHPGDGRRMHVRLTAKGERLNRPDTPGTVEAAVRATLAQCRPKARREVAAVLELFSSQLLDR